MGSHPRLVLLGLACLVWAPGCPGEPAPGSDAGGADAGRAETPWARLQGVAGRVEIRGSASAPWVQVEEGAAVGAAASLRTGPDGRTEVVFQDGRRLRVEPDSQLDLSGTGGQAELQLAQGEVQVGPATAATGEFRVVFGEAREVVRLKEGAVRLRRVEGGELLVRGAEGEAGGFRLVFRDASEMQIARDGGARLSAGGDQTRVRMVLGEARLTRGGQATALRPGQDFQMRLGEVSVLERVPLQARLKAKPGQVSLRLPGDAEFTRAPAKGGPLAPGTALRTRGAITLADGAGGVVQLGPDSQATFEEAYREGASREGKLRLERGQASVRLERGKDEGARQTIVTPHATVIASDRGAPAELKVIARPDATRVEVRAGRAEVKTADELLALGAGESLSVDAQGKAGKREREPMPRIVAQEGVHTQVFYDRAVGKVAFALARVEEGTQAAIELAAAPSFQKPQLRVPVEIGYLAHPARGGRTYFRVLRSEGGEWKPGAVGSLELLPDPLARRRDGSGVTNVVPDTGVQTRILFQGQAPALSFQWDPLEGATAYRVRVYTEDDLETPHLEERVSERRLKLPAGKLGEGVYYWYQAALDAGGKQLKANQMNKLVLAFDNAATLLRIDAPRPGEKPVGGKIDVRGRAPVGASVAVNGTALVVADDGRFEQRLTGLSPGALLLFQLRRPGGGPVLYLRHLGR